MLLVLRVVVVVSYVRHLDNSCSGLLALADLDLPKDRNQKPRGDMRRY